MFEMEHFNNNMIVKIATLRKDTKNCFFYIYFPLTIVFSCYLNTFLFLLCCVVSESWDGNWISIGSNDIIEDDKIIL